MVVSTNIEANKRDFEKLLSSTLIVLQKDAKSDSKEFVKNAGRKLEGVVYDIMNDRAKGTPFDGTIEHIGGQKFPDIIAKKYYGVEVKTTIGEHWRTVGNSVMEGTRVDGIEKIYLLFGKLIDPIEFKIRPYEKCLSEVVVTHSPRYLIDMDLKDGNTIFDKMKIEYEELRKQDNPVKPIIEYYKTTLQEGESLWWLDSGENTSASSLAVKLWSNLTTQQRHDLVIKAMVYFPEIFNNNPKKYSKLAIWLITTKSIVCPNLRDNFTAGGRVIVRYKKRKYIVPQIIKHLIDNFPEVKDVIAKTSSEQLSIYWNTKVSDTNKLKIWLNLFEENAGLILNLERVPILNILLNK